MTEKIRSLGRVHLVFSTISEMFSMRALGFALSLCIAASIVAHFHDRFWWPPDDGAYAYVAKRLLEGAVLNGDVQDVHAGYVNFVNAAALWLFGADLVSLRYPLAFLTVVQAGIVYLLLLPRGVIPALVGSGALSSLSFVQFLNPTANWYALFFFLVVVAVLTWYPRESRGRVEIIGFLLALLFLFRQLSGVILAIGVVTWLLMESRTDGNRSRLARSLLLVMAIGLAMYMWGKWSAIGFLVYGLWPLALLVRAWTTVKIDDRTTLSVIRQLLAGAIAAAAPLVLYHLYHGTLSFWIQDAFLIAFRFNGLDFFAFAGFWAIFLTAGDAVINTGHLQEMASGSFWIAMLLLPPILGLLVLDKWQPRHPLPMLAVFYGLVSIHFQIPIYMTYSMGATVLGILWVISSSPRKSAAITGLVTALSLMGLMLQAGQPLTRGIDGIVRGETVALTAETGLPGARLAMTADDRDTYRQLLALVDTYAAPSDAILAVPVNPELYFLSGRRSPLRYWNTALGLHTQADLHAALTALHGNPPAMVFHRPDDKYNTPLSEQLMAHIKQRFFRLTNVDGFDVYLPK